MILYSSAWNLNAKIKSTLSACFMWCKSLNVNAHNSFNLSLICQPTHSHNLETRLTHLYVEICKDIGRRDPWLRDKAHGVSPLTLTPLPWDVRTAERTRSRCFFPLLTLSAYARTLLQRERGSSPITKDKRLQHKPKF